MSCGIYKITNLLNNKCYIGQSVYIERRFTKHKNFDLEKKDYPLYVDFEKYGIENFSFEIIELCSQEELNEKEKYWIEYFDSFNNGYNQTIGGSGTQNREDKLTNEEVLQICNLLKNTNLTQKEIASKFNVCEDTITKINCGNTRIQKDLKYPIRKLVRHEKKYCIDCGTEIYFNATRCNKCNHKLQRVSERPSRKELKQLIRTLPFTQIGKMYNVTDNSIRKWCISENLPTTKKDINSYSDEEWESI